METGEGRKTPDDASVPELIGRLAEDLSTLVRKEVQLAKTEILEKVKGLGLGVGLFGGAGAIGFLAFGSLTAAIILGLGQVMPHAIAALIVAVFYALVAFTVFLAGRKRLKTAAPPVPTETIDQMKEDMQWLKGRTSRGGS
jgi:hypothetical protein